MTKINLSHFVRYDFKKLYAHIIALKGLKFKIVIPRLVMAVKDDNFSVFWEYYSAAYAGQLLSQIATRFAYYVPCVYDKKPFVFEVTIPETEKLVDALYFIIIGFYDIDDGDMFLDFHAKAAALLNDAFEEKEQAAAFGLLYIASIYLQD